MIFKQKQCPATLASLLKAHILSDGKIFAVLRIIMPSAEFFG